MSISRRVLASLLVVLALVAPTLAQQLAISCRLQDVSLYTARLTALRRWSLFDGPKGGILGAHLVSARQANADLWVLTVRVSNGACLSNGTGFGGKVYFSELWIDAAPGWSIEPEVPRCQGTFGGQRMPLVAPGAHVMLAGEQFIRRFALRRGAVTVAQAHAEIDRVDMRKANAARTDWGPSRIRLPDIDIARQEKLYAAKLATLRADLALGHPSPSNDIRRAALGTQQGPGNVTAYEQGGQGIYFASLAQSPSALLFERALADLWQERMSTACFNLDTGARITSEDWAKSATSNYQPFECQAHGDEEAHDPYAANHWPHFPPALDPSKVFGSGGYSPEEGPKSEIDTVDDAHLTRATLSAKEHGIDAQRDVQQLVESCGPLMQHLRMDAFPNVADSRKLTGR